jgi:hypothetical protein
MNAFWYAESDSEAQCAPAVVRDLVRDAVRRAAHADQLILPYAYADHATSFATVPVADVLGAMR